jgi:predicted acyl esterase
MSDEPQGLREMKEYKNEQIEVIYRAATPIDKSMPPGKYPALAPGVTTEDGIIYERDIPVTMRDGVVIYTDIYRPEGATNVPAIVAYSHYGKRQGYLGMPTLGVPDGTVSPMAKFEAPDPAYWCRYGYAVINPDSRGIGNSEGDIGFWGTQEGRDGYDLIEWVAARDWCNGKVTLSGSSWLGITQWFIAAEKPPHLAAIAPWEGFDDFYREGCCIGGIPEVGFVSMAIEGLCGHGRIEDIPAMMEKYPFINGFWEDKIARVENIEIPAYVVSSWNPLHTHGTFDGYRRLPTEKKWLRIHNTQEWPDYYSPNNIEDLRRFFDRYLKGIHNGWELTPRVRVSVLDPGGTDQVNRPEDDFPLPQTEYQKLYLDATTGTLSPNPIAKESNIRYKADDDRGRVSFTVKFSEDTEITGYMKLHLWVEADGSDDMDLFVYVSKLDGEGNHLPAMVIGFPNPGARGLLRVSHRGIDRTRSTPSEPYLTHRSEQRLKPKEIVPVEIGIWPVGMLWHSGQQLRVVVQGYADWWMEDKLIPGGPIFRYERRNRGDHIIHTGGKYDSHLLIPKIPR